MKSTISQLVFLSFLGLGVALPRVVFAAVPSSSKGKVSKPGATMISTTVAKVKNHIVTSREVQINQKVEAVLFPVKKGKAPAKIEVGDKKFYQHVNKVLLEWVVYLEAQAFDAVPVSNTELEIAEKSIFKVGKSSKEWKSLGVRLDELRPLVQRKLQAKKFIQFKAKSSVVPVTDQEALLYFEEHRLEFGSLPYENFQGNIKAFLARKHVDQRLKDWFEVLQNKYKVRNFIAER